MPVNQLKIDRGFITSISSDDSDRTIVESTINLAHSLKLQVTAEGVPNEDTLRMLARMGCDYACGFYLSEAVSLADLPETVERLNATVPTALAIHP
jgi:EAL domain-containing protein (putative c-di-GMP-specific phosphodiesterase class I)